MSQEKKHIVLAGDSIFDNGSYVPGQPDVAQQLRNQLGEDSNVTLLAIDGDELVSSQPTYRSFLAPPGNSKSM